MKAHFTALAAAALLACAPASAAPATPPKPASAAATVESRQINALADEYYESLARFEPVWATENGDSRFNDKLGLSISPTIRNKQFALYRSYLKRLASIPRDRLGSRDQTSHDILKFELDTALRLAAFPEHLIPIDQMVSMPVILANYAGGQGAQPLGTVRDYRAYLARLAQLVPHIDQSITNMREGIRRGVVQPREPMVSALPQFRQLVATKTEDSIFYTPIRNMPASFTAADKRSLRDAYRKAIANKLNPALKRLSTFLEKDYLPKTRSSAGWNALPNGAAWYAARAAAMTTTSLTPAQIHEIGLKEVARIQGEYAVTGPKMGYTGPAAGLPRWVSEQPKFKPFTSEQQVIDVYRELDARVRTKLPALFTLMPKSPLDLRLEPELSRATASDHYTPPAADGSRPGVFWSVVNDPRLYGSTGMVTLYLHEGQPGHHFHIALVQELGLPNFRKFGGNNAFTEGWALYAETLGKEMGLFEKPEDYFGHLNDEMLRAARLVVDTGLHAKGWSRSKAITYFQDTLGYSEAEARAQIERYMVWPGQALGYKIGSLKIMELRKRAQDALGDKFSLPAFHAIVLGEGTLPLAVLEAKVDRWIAQSK
ncbi:DUF885 domain-containing protein [Massilia yuzhufengensis]|uniref:Uncharacterized conserved protein, DUF885 familyt n=1 Tax=Massilia yuzhufengensis TaxID=1164594 RepID=A0A1I1UX02_9BURK|nr:DUF885 domain-containing protein [Massilia yuzhufengensis]SFD75341.1 Uncharacterized conserved protein, DUF885 familyt [Massilia yuzhufengensis]